MYDFPDNDIAILHLSATLSSSAYVFPACLPNGELPPDDHICYAIGYGIFGKFYHWCFVIVHEKANFFAQKIGIKKSSNYLKNKTIILE